MLYQQISFDEAYDILRTKYIEEEVEKIYSVSNVEILIHDFKEKTIKVQSLKAKDTQYVKKSDLETVVNGILNDEIKKPSDIRNLDVKKDTISLGGLYLPIAKKLVELIRNTKKSLEQKEKNFYIVIDEINRGNISKIFGELITLIEEDKRDNLEVTLPYSKEKFKIPSNLYIIATMNSTDKSIASIDIALRRRFTFLKMQPKSILVKDTDAKELMEKLNVFIKDTRGEDFMLGHSYFMSGLDLEFIKEYKLKPLLEEYFYGDEENYKKALDILGDKNK
ncbi:dynein-related subfamily AAA family protein [Malaciobacter marinus]|jgi:5-methylcytosine-specific restriction protein B|uniref:Dynein-related subfamily AAA family protein n=1 Tax=Malaciobacter marinus TaxID=505249 RepID=A0AB36ZVJ8_9BACT|nr:AAA family ATPase [Malaciobacter marinus]PPK60561.1 dynein-related subfamily AAA family protein [Malaciobacter marinus]